MYRSFYYGAMLGEFGVHVFDRSRKVVKYAGPWSAKQLEELTGALTWRGVARLTEKDGWTALAFWGSDSSCVYVAEGVRTSEKMVRMFERDFPNVTKRFTEKIEPYKKETIYDGDEVQEILDGMDRRCGNACASEAHDRGVSAGASHVLCSPGHD